MDSNKTSLYREVNATTEAMLKQFEADHPGSFLCECPDVRCDRRLALTHQEYEGVRLSRAYLVSLDCIGDSDVLARTNRYAVVDFRGSATEGPGSSQPGSSHSALSQPVWSGPALSPRARSLTAAARTGAAARLSAQRAARCARGASPASPPVQDLRLRSEAARASTPLPPPAC